jgi:hypothetical protein
MFPRRIPSTALLPTVVTALALVSAPWGARPAAAQTVTLGSPTAEYLEGLSFVQSLREMPDGRLLVADPLAQELFFLDMDSGTVQSIGRPGGGPMEFRQPDSVWPFGGGNSLMVDLGNARMVVLADDGSFGDTYPLVMGEPGPGSPMLLLLPQGVDGEGNVYVTQRPAFDPSGEPGDSSMVVRVSLADQRVDTVARVKTQDLTVQRSGGNVSMRQIPLSPADAWGVAPDGRVVIARSGDYHVAWHHPDGSVVAGRPVPFEPVRIRDAEKLAYLEAASGGGISVSIEAGGDGRRSMSLARGGGGRDDGPDLDAYEWPETMPPMTNGRINVDARGRAWVRRNMPAGERPLYDVFGADGNRITTFELAEGRRILGFGEGSVYVAYNDEFDLVYLERYALPAM